MPEITHGLLDDTDMMLLGEMEFTPDEPEKDNINKGNGAHEYHCRDTHEDIRQNEYNPLTGMQGTLVKTDRLGNLIQDEKVSSPSLIGDESL